jgi:hypothetical protein
MSWNFTGRTIRTPGRDDMLTVFPCHSKEDSQLARELAEFLERGTNAQVFLEDGEIGPGETIVTKAADGLQAEVILLILSPGACPDRWVRPQWEPALLEDPKKAGVKVGTVLARDCEFPGLLRRANFFDVTQDQLGGFRDVKRWLLDLGLGRRELEFEPARQPYFEGRDAEMEKLRQTVADAPGIAVIAGGASAGKTTLALEFARQSRRDFESIVWLNCAGENLAPVLGEMASQLRLSLEGEEDDNLREIASFCSQRRVLVVLDDAPEGADQLIPGGRSSTLLTVSRPDAWKKICREPIVIDALHEQTRLPDLTAQQRELLAAASACGDGPFRLGLISEAAGLELDTAGELLGELVRCGALIQIDARYSRYVTPSMARQPVSKAQALAHAQAVARHFAGWASDESECTADLPQLRRALAWALAQREQWELSCELGKRGVSLLKRERRQAEAFELLEAVAREAERREDRRMLEDCLRDQIWTLESWGREEDARRLSAKRRAICEDQMCLDF